VRWARFAVVAALAATLAVPPRAWGAEADESVRTYAKKASYEDVKFELTNAVIERGLTIDFTGALGRMLERTGPAVGATRTLFREAEFFAFCSAKLSRQMMEADLHNIASCPFVVFIYTTADHPDEVVVGYRRPVPRGTLVSQQALAEVDALLDGIVRQAVR